VIISSTNGIRGFTNTAHYTASKHAVVGLARRLRLRQRYFRWWRI